MANDRARAVAAGARSTILSVLPLYAGVLFLSALLLFAVQPLFTRMVVPLLGGSPNVWNTAMLFFQTMLLLGYAYAHLSQRHLAPKAQISLHLVVLLAAFVVLPLGIAEGWDQPPTEAPVPWLIGLFLVSIGLPFFAVAANAPLLQRWFSYTGHHTADDPYYLYGASNLGSLLALLSYPVLIEPTLRLADQSWTWSAGYMVLVLGIGLCAVAVVAAGRNTGVTVDAEEATETASSSWRQRLTWLGLAFIPSSLMLGITTHLSTDVASVPLLWVLPLSLYLLTFVIVFARKPIVPQSLVVTAQGIALVVFAIMFNLSGKSIVLSLVLGLTAFFATALMCHGELARRRPHVGDLTEFYLWMSLGGALGGVFNVLVAPQIFSSIVELPLLLALSCLARPVIGAVGRFTHVLDWIIPAALLGALAAAVALIGTGSDNLSVLFALPVLIVAALVAYACAGRPIRFAMAIGAVFIANAMIGDAKTVHTERGFFGVHRVQHSSDGAYKLLVHGTTVHGIQATAPERRREPLSYFHKEGPFGQLFAALHERRSLNRVGVVGLGAGTLACYAQPGEEWTFYEIDPLVRDIVTTSGHFTYLRDCAPGANIVLGDARLSLRHAEPAEFDLLALDAFSSDAIPVHLLTREALQLYLEKLAPDGVIVFNLSNRYLNVVPMVVSLAKSEGLAVRIQRDIIGPEAIRKGARSVELALVARNETTLQQLAGPRWETGDSLPRVRPWTDDYSNIVSALLMHFRRDDDAM